MPDFEPISLGHTCEVKYQLSRKLFFSQRPEAPADSVREIIHQRYGSSYFPRHVFDFQITPFSAVCEYLQSDFKGVFEREDLFVDPATGHVTHKRLWTSHPHDFEPGDGGIVDDALIDRLYGDARSKFEHLAQRFRDHLNTPGRFLYVFMEMRSPADAERLLGLLSAGHPGHEASLLFVDDPARDIDYPGLDGRVFKAHRIAESGKPPIHAWEGHDAGWDAALAPFALRTSAAAPAAERNLAQAQGGLDPDNAGSPWRRLDLSWTSHLPGGAPSQASPATVRTPEQAWGYGATTSLIDLQGPATIQVRGRAISGKIGLCLITADFGALASDQHMITPQASETSVMIAFEPSRAPARLLVRNYDDEGQGGELRIEGVWVRQSA